MRTERIRREAPGSGARNQFLRETPCLTWCLMQNLVSRGIGRNGGVLSRGAQAGTGRMERSGPGSRRQASAPALRRRSDRMEVQWPLPRAGPTGSSSGSPPPSSSCSRTRRRGRVAEQQGDRPGRRAQARSSTPTPVRDDRRRRRTRSPCSSTSSAPSASTSRTGYGAQIQALAKDGKITLEVPPDRDPGPVSRPRTNYSSRAGAADVLRGGGARPEPVPGLPERAVHEPAGREHPGLTDAQLSDYAKQVGADKASRVHQGRHVRQVSGRAGHRSQDPGHAHDRASTASASTCRTATSRRSTRSSPRTACSPASERQHLPEPRIRTTIDLWCFAPWSGVSGPASTTTTQPPQIDRSAEASARLWLRKTVSSRSRA